MNENEIPIYITGGRLGDVFHVLAVIHAKKIPSILYLTDDLNFGGDHFSFGVEDTFNKLYPLMMKQTYIKELRIHKKGQYFPYNNFINLNDWRIKLIQNQKEGRDQNWIDLLENVYKIKIPSPKGPWIEFSNLEMTDKYDIFKDKIVIHHSALRDTPDFPWKRLIELNNCIFVSYNPNEHYKFCVKMNIMVDFYKINSIEEYANIIMNCKFFIGNLSSPVALAWALGKEFLAILNIGDQYSYMYPHIRWYYNNFTMNLLDTFNYIKL